MLLLRSIFFTVIQPGTVTILIPYWLLSWRPKPFLSDHNSLRVFGVPLIIIGAAGLLWCIWDFFSAGRGTIAPIDPPKHLVVRGLYRYLRNPMYVFVIMILVGEAIFFNSLSILIEAVGFFVVAHLFVMYYEEPTLHGMFGKSYEAYTENVGRWLPNLRRRTTGVEP